MIVFYRHQQHQQLQQHLLLHQHHNTTKLNWIDLQQLRYWKCAKIIGITVFEHITQCLW